MSSPYPVQLSRRIALSLGLMLVRWARRPALSSPQSRARPPSTAGADAGLLATAPAAQTRVDHTRARQDEQQHARAIRQRVVDREVEAERMRAQQRALVWPGHS